MALLLLVNGFAPGALGGCASLLALSPEDDAADPEAPVKHLKAWGGQHVVDTSDIRRGEVWVLHSTWLDGTETYEVLVGPNEAPMSWPAFYRMVDRPDLAESFEQRSLIKEVADWTFIIGSAAAVIPIGLGIAGIAVFFTPLGGIPFGVILLGTAVLTAVLASVVTATAYAVPVFLSDWSISMEENYRLINDYNRQLGETPAEAERPHTTRAPSPLPASVAPVLF